MAKKADKPSVLRSRGVMRDASRSARLVTAAVLVLSCAALTFTQLGFAGITDPDGTGTAYIIVLLLPVAIGALLLGTLAGTCIGLVAGGVLYGHAAAMPLDFYEMTFVTPLTSVAMLGVSGFLLGFLFAFALRHDPGQVKRVIYVAIVCIVVSFLYSIGFVTNVTITMVVNLAAELAAEGASSVDSTQITQLTDKGVATMALRIGDLSVQVWIDALLMAASCIAADAIARKALRAAGNRGLRGVFAARLAVVVFVAFMVSAGASFVAITQGEIADASRNMKSEAAYLHKQLAAADSRSESLGDYLDKQDVDLGEIGDDAFGSLVKSVSFDTLLDGYTKEEDGTILVLLPDYDISGEMELVRNGRFVIEMTDDDSFGKEKHLDEIVDEEFIAAFERSVAEGEMRRVVYDETGGKSVSEIVEAGDSVRSEIVYLYAEEGEVYTVMIMKPASMVFADRDAIMAWTTLSEFVLLAAVFAMVFWLLSRAVVRRIDETNDVLGRITDGDLEARVDVKDTREFKSLSGGINATVDALKGWIAEAETRMDAELATAKAIQESALPRTFPPYPDIWRFDIYASMNPAREVGGDFYDFFLVGDECGPDAGKLGFVIADVSGKGVPAALFMMKAMTQIRDYLQSGMDVGEAAENANRQLCDGNDAGMFVTAWFGVLDYATGHVDYVNAGHNPPLLWQEGAWRWLPDKSGLPMGLFDGFPYEAFSVDCGIGDQFLLYTDGVTEAMSESGDLFGEQRLEDLAKTCFALHPRQLVEAVRRSVARHARGAEQSDDITVLALEVGVPPELTATIIVPADVDELPHVNEFIHTELDRRLCPKKTQNQLDIAVEELFVNVARYAYPDAEPDSPGMVRVSYTYTADPPSVRVDIADDGIPYNPLDKPDAVTPDDIVDVPIGGLGILMAKRSVDEMAYEHTGRSNIVTIVKKW